MATANQALINALRVTTKKLSEGKKYQWSHMGSCNCGHLAQNITKLSKQQIHAYALEKAGDWAQQVLEFCPTSGYPMDHIIDAMLQIGMTREDLVHLERLSDYSILRRIPFERRNAMQKNNREDVVLYMETWAQLLEEQLVENTQGDHLETLTEVIP